MFYYFKVHEIRLRNKIVVQQNLAWIICNGKFSFIAQTDHLCPLIRLTLESRAKIHHAFCIGESHPRACPGIECFQFKYLIKREKHTVKYCRSILQLKGKIKLNGSI